MEENKEATKQDDPDRPLQGYEYLDHTVIYTRCPNKFLTEIKLAFLTASSVAIAVLQVAVIGIL